jgi:two-component system CheB/CheR fusion protein
VLVIGVGASAGGLDACQRFLHGAPADRGMAFIIVFHLAPAEESHVAGILQRSTHMKVAQVTGSEHVEPNHVYVIAPATSLGLRDGALAAGAPEEPHYRARPIDAFFSALAADQKERAAGIVLSGTGNDGSAGLEAIRSAGGLCLVQDPATAEFDGMPRSAIDTGAADAVVPPEAMGEILLRYAEEPRIRPSAREPKPPDETEPEEGLAAILQLLGRRYRVDFRDYKTGTLERRTQRRIELKRTSGWQGYLQLLKTDAAEVDELYRDLLIGVTSFFRDAEDWELLAREVLPSLVEGRRDAAELRVWSAGCATGEEAYSLAMVFLEHLEAAGSTLKLKVFASDASDAALAIARRGLYPATIAEHVATERLRRFFRQSGEGFEVERALRDAVTFAAHDLLSDPPFAHLDLVSCRNVLIYLEAAAQERSLELFHFSLRPQGILWLGAAETIGRRTDLFEELPGKHRLYRSTGTERSGRYHPARRAGDTGPVRALRERTAPETPRVARLLEKLVLQRHTSPCVVIDQRLEILHFFGPTEEYLTRPQGEARSDLLSWVRPELFAKLRRGLAEAVEHKRQVAVTCVRLERDAAPARIEIVIEPITSIARAGGLLLVVFRDLPSSRGTSSTAEEGGEKVGALAGQLQQELEDTREELRAAVDQLRTATEEHSASYEELTSLNEEFQSSNEELEASKEELQSVNEELTTINRQLEERNTELRSLSSDLNNLLVSANVATIFLDRELRIRRFTPACAAVLRLVPADVGRSLSDLKMQVRDEHLLADALRVLARPALLEAEVATEDGRWFLRRVLPYRTEEEEIDGVCLTFHEITAQKHAADVLGQDDRRKNEFLAMLGHELRNPLAALANGLDLLGLTGGEAVEPVRAMMERQTRRMTAMLDQLLDVSRVISGAFELTRDAADMVEAARAAIESVKPMLEAAGHELTVSLPPTGTVLVLGDALRLAQVMENLLANAVKYTENGGRIWLTVETPEDTVRLSVRDTGVGMEPASLERIFDLFAQAPVSLHRARGGLGLGLALVRSLVKMHGGSVAAFSAGPGLGAEIVVTLPRLRRGRLARPAQAQAAPPAVTARRILIVEDEADNAQALVRILTLQGHQARAVPDGIAALEAVAELDPELVLLDLGLPEMNGYEVARRLREQLGRRVFLVALTGYQADKPRLQEAGFDAHLLKPTRLEKLIALLAELDRRDEAAPAPATPPP